MIKKISELNELQSASTVDIAPIVDSNNNETKKIKIENLLTGIVAKNAAAHNGIFRGKDITELFENGKLSQQISAGTFDDIFIGDYIIRNGRKYLVADLDYRLNTGDTETTRHHILMIPERTMGTAQMNASNIVTGGYNGSAMKTTNLNSFKNTINTDFGAAHILNHRELFTNAVSGDKSSGWAWYDATVDLMNESMVYGHNAWGSHHGYETGIDKQQLSLFRLKPSAIVAKNSNGDRQWYWLRDVVSSALFASVGSYGYAYNSSASTSTGVRPAFLLV